MDNEIISDRFGSVKNDNPGEAVRDDQNKHFIHKRWCFVV